MDGLLYLSSNHTKNGKFSLRLSFQVPAAAFLVITERNLKVEDQKRNLKIEESSYTGQVNMMFYLFWMHFYQLLTALCLFWADFIPAFGYTDNIQHFWEKYVCFIQLYSQIHAICVCGKYHYFFWESLVIGANIYIRRCPYTIASIPNLISYTSCFTVVLYI